MSSNSTGGIGVGGLLTVTFVVLKICKVIAWSWWWVLAPTWIPLGLVVIFLLGLVVIFLLGLLAIGILSKLVNS